MRSSLAVRLLSSEGGATICMCWMRKLKSKTFGCSFPEKPSRTSTVEPGSFSAKSAGFIGSASMSKATSGVYCKCNGISRASSCHSGSPPAASNLRYSCVHEQSSSNQYQLICVSNGTKTRTMYALAGGVCLLSIASLLLLHALFRRFLRRE